MYGIEHSAEAALGEHSEDLLQTVRLVVTFYLPMGGTNQMATKPIAQQHPVPEPVGSPYCSGHITYTLRALNRVFREQHGE
jgi:hypothetical protein